MVQQFWDQRYAENETVYGQEPNKFLKLFIDLHRPGSLLLPAEGEGRNAVYAARKGWEVDAFDFSEVAREKALFMAKGEHVDINYELKSFESYKAGKKYDAVGLIYTHMPPAMRKTFHKEICDSIKPGGFLVMEVFSTKQLNYESGGPRDESLLYSAADLCEDFSKLDIMTCEEKIIQLDEGPYHKGEAAVIRLTGQKKIN